MAQVRSFFKQASAWPIYAWLVAAYPVIALYSLNIGLVLAEEVWLALGVTLGIFTALAIVLSLILRSLQKGAVTAAIIAIGFFTMGHFWLLISGEAIDASTRVPEWLLPLWVGGTLLLAGLAAWKLPAGGLRKAAPSLNLVLAGLVAFTSIRIVESAGQALASGPGDASSSVPKVMNDAQHPDVYFIILDGYSANKHLMREWGYDNSDFTNELEKRGFYVAYDATTVYGQTLPSIASTLNMRFLAENENPPTDPSGVLYGRTLISDSEVAKRFQGLGYTYIFMMSGFDIPSKIADYNMDFWYEGGMKLYPKNSPPPADSYPSEPFTAALMRTTVLLDPRASTNLTPPPIRNKLVISFLDLERMKHEWRQTARIAERPEATFTVVHMLKPHHGPQMFDRNGNVFPEPDPEFVEPYFFEQLKYVNERTLKMIDQILETSTVPPIIIIAGDHGSHLGYGYNPDGRHTNFEIMDVYYFPNGGDKNLYRNISSVNSFRVLFDTYFGGHYDLLPDDKHYEILQGYTSIFHFSEYKMPGQ